MQFNAKDDFVNEYQAELEQELDAEHKLEDEQDHDFDLKEDVEEDIDDELPNLSNPMCDYSPQEELDRVSNRDSYEAFRGY
jgi:hypothetical protein